MAKTSLASRIGGKMAECGRSCWLSPHMAAASRAIADRIPLVDLLLEVRDARIPLSSEVEQLKNHGSSPRRIVVLNKVDLADSCRTKEWMRYFEQNNCVSYGVNAHNTKNIQQFLNFLQARIRELGKNSHSSTWTVLLVGIPNVGKSALANSLHKIGRISAAEKGKLKKATVSPHPGETKDISSLKIGSHPNVYVLDSPGILPPRISDAEICSKLALTGAISDGLIGEELLARYFLSVLNSSDEYKKWSKLYHDEDERPMSMTEVDTKQRRQYPSDHTQDSTVNSVRQMLCRTISSFEGDVENERDLLELTEAEIVALGKAFKIPMEEEKEKEEGVYKVCRKLLNLYRTGRLGHYTLDSI